MEPEIDRLLPLRPDLDGWTLYLGSQKMHHNNLAIIRPCIQWKDEVDIGSTWKHTVFVDGKFRPNYIGLWQS